MMASRAGQNQLLIAATVGKHTSRMASWRGPRIHAKISQSKNINEDRLIHAQQRKAGHFS